MSFRVQELLVQVNEGGAAATDTQTWGPLLGEKTCSPAERPLAAYELLQQQLRQALAVS